jgi:hypothetical protein
MSIMCWKLTIVKDVLLTKYRTLRENLVSNYSSCLVLFLFSDYRKYRTLRRICTQ